MPEHLIFSSASYIAAVGLGLFSIVFFLVRRKPVFRSMGLTFNRWLLIDLMVGLLITFGAIGLVFLVEWALGSISVEPGSLTFSSFLRDVLAPILTAAIIEELLFRVLLLTGVAILLSRLKYGRWIAVVSTAVVFGALHLGNEGATAVTAFGTGLGGLMYGIAFLATRSMWLPLGLHVGWNMSQGLLGFAISGHQVPGWLTSISIGPEILNGGTYGPEGGIPGMLSRFLIIALIVLYVERRWPDGRLSDLNFAPGPEKKRRKKNRLGPTVQGRRAAGK